MTPFLKQVAKHYHPAPNISRMCFVFPNKRSLAFFRKYLAECSAAARKAIAAPDCLTINDFFVSLDSLRSGDRISQLITLYDCYKELNPAAESLDEFLFWGGVLLSDFAEVDKYLVNASHIFTNVGDYRRMQDSFDYLNPAQKHAMEQFLGHFASPGEYKERFRRIWDILLPLYTNFNACLSESGLATEGMIYRRIAERCNSEAVSDILGKVYPDTEKFIFVGLNALNECEKKLLRKMRDASLAEFCWDFRSDEIRDSANRASFFMARNLEEFRNAFETDAEGLSRPVVNVVSVPSAVGQSKQLPAILGKDAGIETAVVLPEESLLLNVLNSIPEDIPDINATMGYPMKGSEFHALLKDIAAMQLNVRDKDGQTFFYHKYVWGIFSNGIVHKLLGKEGNDFVKSIKSAARYYIPAADFAGNDLLEFIFRPATDIAQYLRSLTFALAGMMREDGSMQMELQFAMYVYKAVTRLADINPRIQARTWWRLFDQLISGTSVPFEGEPLKGLQIMGPLETRALDFDKLIILSCNEGIFPRRSVGASFIPAELRKGFGLPTYEYQDAVWAYYFYRLIQRASEVWLLFDSRTELSRSGEQSRYIRQLQMLYGFEIRSHIIESEIAPGTYEDSIAKTEGDIDILRSGQLSVSALQAYLACPAKFYYSKIRGLKAADEVSENLDSGMIGRVLHSTLETLYKGRGKITRDYLKSLMDGDASYRPLVKEGIMKELRADEVTGRNLIFEELICSYVRQVLKTDLDMLDSHHRSAFDILGTELRKTARIEGLEFVGVVDRIDSFEPGTVRIVDYKTGKVLDSELDINDDNAHGVVDALFGDKNKDRPKIALQLYIYDVLMDGDPAVAGKRIENSIYQTTRIFRETPKGTPRSEEFCRLMKDGLKDLLQKICDPAIPWTRTSEPDTCKYCDFKTICGK